MLRFGRLINIIFLKSFPLWKKQFSPDAHRLQQRKRGA